jgi:hypothetical protein
LQLPVLQAILMKERELDDTRHNFQVVKEAQSRQERILVGDGQDRNSGGVKSFCEKIKG